MKAVLLLIELKRDLQRCQDEVEFLASKLPAYAEKIMYGARMIGFLMPRHDILAAMHAPLRNALSPFENYWLVGLSGEVHAKNGGFDPLVSGIKQYTVPPVHGRQRAKT